MSDPVQVIVAGKKAVGIKMMESVERAFTNRIQSKIHEVEETISQKEVEKLAWNILGQADLYARKLQLEKDLEDVNSKMSDFDGGRCSLRDSYGYGRGRGKDKTQLEDARAAAYEALYPEIDALKKLKQEVEFRVTICTIPGEFKEVAEWLDKELNKIPTK
jgi:hypothetical protein